MSDFQVPSLNAAATALTTIAGILARRARSMVGVVAGDGSRGRERAQASARPSLGAVVDGAPIDADMNTESPHPLPLSRKGPRGGPGQF